MREYKIEEQSVRISKHFFKMTTGDLKNNLRKLHSELKLVNYSGELDIVGLSIGKPSAFLPILHFVLTEFSRDLAQYFFSKDYELLRKNDLKFVQVVYRILRDEFSAKAALTKDQFFTLGFAERKLQFVASVVQLCRIKSESLKPKRIKTFTGLNTAKTSKNKLHVIQAKTCNSQPGAAQITMDTLSEKCPRPSVIRSKESPKDIPAIPGILLSESGTTEDTSSQNVSRAAVSENASDYIKDNSGNFRRLGLDTSLKHTDENTKRPSKSYLLPGSTPNCTFFDKYEGGQTEHYFPGVITKENIPPRKSYKTSNHEELSAGSSLRFSPIPLTQTKVHQDFQSAQELSWQRIDTSGNYGRNRVEPRTIDFNETGTSLTPDNEILIQSLERQRESSVIINYLRTQGKHIAELKKDAREREIIVHNLVQKNSELTARILVMETTVKLLEEKIY